MKKIHLLLIIFSLDLLLFAGTGSGALTVNPITLSSGETVTATVSGNLPAGAISISFAIDFGDGSPAVTSPSFTTAGANSFSATRSYSRAGSFTITATTIVVTAAVPLPPVIETQNITVIDAVGALPRGIVGEAYDFNISSTSTTRGARYRIIGGSLAPGLKLDRNGAISGIPTQKGVFNFTVQIASAQGATITQNLTLFVDPGMLVIQVTPEMIETTRGGGTTQEVTFTVSSPTVQIRETIRSSRGEFLAGGRVLGFVGSPLNINLNTVRPSASETIRIPNNVLRAAQDTGTSRITYRRTFRAQNLTSGSGTAAINMRTAAAGELRITRLRVFFEQNNRPIILVSRNSRKLTGVAEIHYNGSGTIKGLWQVDGRILERVQKNLYYGKVLTLKTPGAPPLPTYSEGAYRLQFIITEPVSARQKIDFPEAIYHVEAKQAENIAPLALEYPRSGDVLRATTGETVFGEKTQQAATDNRPRPDTSGATFSWEKAQRAVTYRIEFFEQDSDSPFFTAYAKNESYTLPKQILRLRFTPGKSYQWQVQGFNRANELTAASEQRTFTLEEPSVFVPQQVIFIVNNDDTGRDLIPEIVAKYELEILQQTRLASIDRIMVLCKTDGDVQSIAAQLANETGLYGSQPNYIFSTMSDGDPLRSMQSIDRLLDLDRIHKRSSGSNVSIAVIDTGVDYNHKDLQQRIKTHSNFINESTYQSEIHGTAVAGIIAGSRNDFGMLGIAPNADLLAYRACMQLTENNSQGACYSSSIAMAVDAAITAQADIANLSIGTGIEDRLISDLVTKGSGQGVIFIAPVGNDPQAAEISFPASHPDVIAVAGFDPETKPLPNHILAKKADAAAPARNIFTATPGDKHNFMDGTSYSAAIISGVVALSLEANHGSVSKTLPHLSETTLWQKQVSAYIGM